MVLWAAGAPAGAMRHAAGAGALGAQHVGGADMRCDNACTQSASMVADAWSWTTCVAGTLREEQHTRRGPALPLLPASQPSAAGASPSPWHQPASDNCNVCASTVGVRQECTWLIRITEVSCKAYSYGPVCSAAANVLSRG
jgi:hypothetical protein